MLITLIYNIKKFNSINKEFGLISKNSNYEIALNHKKLNIPKIIIFFFNLLPKKLFSVVIHGSYATNEVVKFSDFDDIIFVRKRLTFFFNIYSSLILTIIEILFQFYDLEQHHGHWIYSIVNKQYSSGGLYPNSFFDNSCHLQGKNSYVFQKVNDTNASYYKELYDKTNFYIDIMYQKLLKTGLTLYDLKNLVSAINLLPALKYQSEGVDIDKKTAINIDLESNDLLRWSSAIRNNWNSLIVSYRNNLFYILIFDPILCRKFQMKFGKLIKFKDLTFEGD